VLVDKNDRVVATGAPKPQDTSFDQGLDEACKFCCDHQHDVPAKSGNRGDVAGFTFGFSHGNGRSVSSHRRFMSFF
jgi:hypothetical protein